MTRFARLTAALAACLLAATLVTTTAAAAPSDDAGQRFEALLRQIDVVPSRAQLDGGWSDAKARLLAAARDDARDEWTRSRALSMLSFYPDADVRAALEGLAGHERPAVRELAVYTVARTFGAPGDEALVALVADATADRAAAVRAKAVRALRWIDHPAAHEALTRIARESADRDVRALADHVRARRDDRVRRQGR